MIKNGNYYYELKADGTKIRYKKANDIDCIPDYPESIDFKITDTCHNNCEFCYMNATKDEKHGDFNYIKSIIDQLPKYTELAIGGGNPLEHPYIDEILDYAKHKSLYANLTIHAWDLTPRVLMRNINAIGVSVQTEEQFKCVKPYVDKNIIIHTILGITDIRLIKEMIDYGFKVLVLGLKPIGKTSMELISDFNNSIDFIKSEIYNIMDSITDENSDKVISFDCLAVNQLSLSEKLGSKFDDFYMGDDSVFTCYVDAVNKEIKGSSLCEHGQILTDCNLKEMFKNLGGV